MSNYNSYHRQNVDGEIDGGGRIQGREVLLEIEHEVLRQFHVLEHALQFGGETATAFLNNKF